MRDFQREGIRYLIDPDVSNKALLLVARTGSGKSWVMLGAATLLRGVTLIIIPTLSLAHDQLAKFKRGAFKDLTALHLDDIKNDHEVKRLVKKIFALKEMLPSERPRVLIFASPQSLADNQHRHSKQAFLFKKFRSRIRHELETCVR